MAFVRLFVQLNYWRVCCLINQKLELEILIRSFKFITCATRKQMNQEPDEIEANGNTETNHIRFKLIA